jgi:hypothetical protein
VFAHRRGHYVFGVGEGSASRPEIKATFFGRFSEALAGSLPHPPLSRLWSEIQRCFDREDDSSVKARTQ